MAVQVYKTEFFIQAFLHEVHGNPNPLFARKGRRRWDFWEGASNVATFTDRGEAVRVLRYLQKKMGHAYARIELVQLEVIHRTTVVLPKPEVVAQLAQLAPVDIDPVRS